MTVFGEKEESLDDCSFILIFYHMPRMQSLISFPEWSGCINFYKIPSFVPVQLVLPVTTGWSLDHTLLTG